MSVVTINGPIGSRGQEVGMRTARLLGADYVDRLILAEAAKRIGSTVEVLDIKTHRKVPLGDRIAYLFQNMLERSTMYEGVPYFTPGMEYLPSEEYTELAAEPLTAAQRLNDEHFMEVTSAVIKDASRSGNVVIIGRGSNMILKDEPGILHVGETAPMELLIHTLMDREHLDWRGAETYATDMEKARVTYFRKFFQVHPDDPGLYHLVLNMGSLSDIAAAEIVAHAAKAIEPAAVLTRSS